VSAAVTLEDARAALRNSLLSSGILVDLGSPGLYGRGGTFERVYQAVDQATLRAMRFLEPETLRFPPVETLATFEGTDYIASFPDLAASISAFTGSDRDHRQLLTARAAGERWESFLAPADLMLTPAVCHPLYPLLTGTLPEGGRTFEILGDSFRHEPSLDPMRLQAFHQHDYVHVGTAEAARAHRDGLIPIMVDLLESFGLEIDVVPANDPFFGRVGQMLAQNQIDEALKFEFVTPVYGDDHAATAISSANLHEDHFGTSFDIRTADGEVAHSSCIGFGAERIVIAMFAAHGVDVGTWPRAVREGLGL
jgi:seryl-tRNA synthetase